VKYVLNKLLKTLNWKNLLKLTEYTILFALVALLVAHGPELHYQYLEHQVGRVTVKALKSEEGYSGGTGFYVKAPSGKNFILTNHHVCGKAVNEIVYIKHETGEASERIVPRRIIDQSEGKDLCLIEGYGDYDGTELASKTSRGSLVWVIGHPRLNSLTVSFGQLINMAYEVNIMIKRNVPKEECNKPYMKWMDTSATPYAFVGVYNICMKTQQAYQSTAVIHPGNSGSAVVNALGNVVGVAFAGDRAGFSYFVRLEDIRDFLSVY
jgi:S1-C subfamily serine protease